MPERRKNNRLIINQIFSCTVRDIPAYGRRLLQARAQEPPSVPEKREENQKVSFLNKSQMTMPAVTDTLSECFVPY